MAKGCPVTLPFLQRLAFLACSFHLSEIRIAVTDVFYFVEVFDVPRRLSFVSKGRGVLEGRCQGDLRAEGFYGE